MPTEDLPDALASRDPSSGEDVAVRHPRTRLYATWEFWFLTVLLALAAITISIGVYGYRRVRVMNLIEADGGEYALTKESEWITDRFGDWAKGFRSVSEIRWSGEFSDSALSQISLLNETEGLYSFRSRGDPITVRGVESLKQLSDLQVLVLGTREFDDELLADYFATAPQLVVVDCVVGPRSMQAISRIPSVALLTCDSAVVFDADRLRLEPMPNLALLNLRTISVGRRTVEWLVQSPHLKHLSIDDSTITDDELQLISQLSELRDLSIASCDSISETGIAHLAHLKQLTHLSLPGDTFTLEIIETLKTFPALTHVSSYGPVDDSIVRAWLEQKWDYTERPDPMDWEY